MRTGKFVMIMGATAAGVLSIGEALAADFGPPPPQAPVYAVPAYEVVNPYCARWTVRCDRRWGFGSPRFARCMYRHGC